MWVLNLPYSSRSYFFTPKTSWWYENFALVKNKLLTAGLISAARCEALEGRWVSGALPECDTCVWLWPCSSSRYGQSWGGWMEYCVLLSSLLSVSSLSDSSPSGSPLDLGGQRVSVLARDPPSPSRRAGRLWMWLCSWRVCGLSSSSSGGGTWLRCSLRGSWLEPCWASALESKRSISLLLLHSLWPRPRVLSRSEEVTRERLFWSFRACALIPNGGHTKLVRDRTQSLPEGLLFSNRKVPLYSTFGFLFAACGRSGIHFSLLLAQMLC